jgi:hypothetical protein
MDNTNKVLRFVHIEITYQPSNIASIFSGKKLAKQKVLIIGK